MQKVDAFYIFLGIQLVVLSFLGTAINYVAS